MTYTVGKGWYDAQSLDFAVQRGLIPVVNGTVDLTAAVSRADFVAAVMKTLREQYFQIVYNLYGAGLAVTPDVASSKTAADFTDGASVPKWAVAATNELVMRGIIQGDDKNRLQIGAAFTIATTAVVMARI